LPGRGAVLCEKFRNLRFREFQGWLESCGIGFAELLLKVSQLLLD
jgi:hypothetical protein